MLSCTSWKFSHISWKPIMQVMVKDYLSTSEHFLIAFVIYNPVMTIKSQIWS